MAPRYSIIVATKNNKITIGPVLFSTLLLARQFDTELIIVDGKSRDGTLDVIKTFLARYGNLYTAAEVLQDPGLSLSYARHLGVKKSKGDIVILLDGDIMLTPSIIRLEEELKDSDLLAPSIIILPLDKVTKIFNTFKYMVNFLSTSQPNIKFTDSSLLPEARVFKRKVLEKLKGYPPLSRFFGEDRIATTLAVRLGFRYKYTLKIKLIKIDDPSYQAYWKKHFRYGKGIVHDIVPLGKSLLKKYIIMRKITYINLVSPTFSFLFFIRTCLFTKSLKPSLDIFLLKYFIDLAMLLGEIHGFISTSSFIRRTNANPNT
ncbi:MAG: glycosyltransferase family 2 protein [Pyrobaculum sp.]|jgi:glycosyltransferase involved in cell wall biosynthesis